MRTIIVMQLHFGSSRLSSTRNYDAVVQEVAKVCGLSGDKVIEKAHPQALKDCFSAYRNLRIGGVRVKVDRTKSDDLVLSIDVGKNIDTAEKIFAIINQMKISDISTSML